MSYRLALLSGIPVARSGTGWETLDLWAVDLAQQVRQTPRLRLICPIADSAPPGWQGAAALPGGIEVMDLSVVTVEGVAEAIKGCDVVQVNGGTGWFESRLSRLVLKAASRLGVKSIVGISSNRARTTLLNARPRRLADVPRSLNALGRYVSLRASYRALTGKADGTFVVGEGVRTLVSARCPTLHVGIASWISADDMQRARALASEPAGARLRNPCIASRLERMKGVHLGIDAIRKVREDASMSDVVLTVYGAGSELENLQAQVRDAAMQGAVVFGGTLAYPGPFLKALRSHGIVMLPNLNDEQPRLIFDAISQGCLPLCPDTPAYAALGLPEALLYRVGDSASLAAAFARLLRSQQRRDELWNTLLGVADRYTLEAMHAARARWVIDEVLRAGRVAPGATAKESPT